MTDNESLRDYLEHLYRDAIESEEFARRGQQNSLREAILHDHAAQIYQRHKEQLYDALKLIALKRMTEQEIANVVNPADDCTCHGGTRPCDCV